MAVAGSAIRQKFCRHRANHDRDEGASQWLGLASTLYGLSFSVNDIDPSYTLGDMERLRREILMRLHKRE